MQDVNVSIANELSPFAEIWPNNVFLFNFQAWIDNWFAHWMIVRGKSFSFQLDTMAKDTNTIMAVLGREAHDGRAVGRAVELGAQRGPQNPLI